MLQPGRTFREVNWGRYCTRRKKAYGFVTPSLLQMVSIHDTEEPFCVVNWSGVDQHVRQIILKFTVEQAKRAGEVAPDDEHGMLGWTQIAGCVGTQLDHDAPS